MSGAQNPPSGGQNPPSGSQTQDPQRPDYPVINNGVKLLGEAVVPGASLLLERNISGGLGAAAIGVLGSAALGSWLGPIGYILGRYGTSAASYASSFPQTNGKDGAQKVANAATSAIKDAGAAQTAAIQKAATDQTEAIKSAGAVQAAAIQKAATDQAAATAEVITRSLEPHLSAMRDIALRMAQPAANTDPAQRAASGEAEAMTALQRRIEALEAQLRSPILRP